MPGVDAEADGNGGGALPPGRRSLLRPCLAISAATSAAVSGLVGSDTAEAVWRGRGPRKALRALKDIEPVAQTPRQKRTSLWLSFNPTRRRAKFDATKRRLAEAAEKIARTGRES